jgi:hypothetical protein
MEDSPSKLRLSQLSHKLNTLSSNIEEEKSNRLEVFLGRLKAVEDKVGRSAFADEAKIKNLKDHVNQLQETVAAERTSREILDERKTKELKLLENNFAMELSVQD